MSIDIKCNSCSSKYSVPDRLAGGSVKCSKCHAPIHVPIVPRQPEPAPAATASDAADLAFEYTPNLGPRGAAQTAALAAAPPAREPEPAESSVAEAPLDESPSPEAAPVARRARLRLNFSWLKFPVRRPALPAADAAPASGFRVRRYWTGALAPSLWILSLVGAAYLIFACLRQLLSLGSLPAELQQWALWSGIVQIVGVAALLIVIRIAIETVSVLFEIAGTLREVRDELRSRS
ncbi:MAG TPA: hypothetical protein VMV10_24290 [Pirellulales bacterium]|nr:hypothetical protein [Pirellulales bacterium]